MAHNISKKLNGISKNYKSVEVFNEKAFTNLYNYGGYSNQLPITLTQGSSDITNTRIKFYPFVVYSKTIIKNFVFDISGFAPSVTNNLITFGFYDILNNKPNQKLWNSPEYNETTLYNTYLVGTRIIIQADLTVDKGVYFFAGQSSLGAVSTVLRSLDTNFVILGTNNIDGTAYVGYTLINTYSNTLPNNVSGGSFVNNLTDNYMFMYIQEK